MDELRSIKSNRALIPLWQTSFIISNKNVRYGLCSDQGCCGVDINVTENDKLGHDSCLDVFTIKEHSNKNSLGAKECCSPFLDPNKECDFKEQQRGLEAFEAAQIRESNFFTYFFINFSKKDNNKDNIKKCLRPIWRRLRNEELRETLMDEDITLPNTVLNYIKRLPTPFPAPKANWLYTGNGLSTTADKALLHSEGSDSSDLVVTKLIENVKDDFIFSGGKRQVLKLKGGRIYGISHKQTLGTDLCLVRKKRRLHILTLEEYEATRVASFKNKVDIESASLSPHIGGEYVLLNANGDLDLHTFTHSVPIAHKEVEHSHVTQFDAGQHWNCDFGAHPRALLYMDRNKFISADLRGSGGKVTKLLRSKNQLLFNLEQLFLFQQSTTNPFQYFVSTTHHLLLVDERFPNVPVQMWKHQLSSFPTLLWQGTYKDPGQSSDNQLVLLASQQPQETCCFQIRPATPQPVSVSLPWYCSGPQDPCRVLRHYGIPVPEMYARRSAFPVTGVCSTPHDRGVSIFHQTSLGDLYCQDYFFPNGTTDCEKTHHFGPGYSPPNAQTLSQRLQDWAQKVPPLSETSMDLPHFQWTEHSSFLDGLMENKPVSETCMFCVPGKTQTVEPSGKCQSCHLRPQDVTALTQGTEKLENIGGCELIKDNPSKSDLQWLFHLTKLDRDFDPFTQDLLKEWDISEMETHSGPTAEVTPSQDLETFIPEHENSPHRTFVNPGDFLKSESDVPELIFYDHNIPVEDSVSKLNRDDFLELSADVSVENSSFKRGSQVLSDNECDIIPPSQNYDEQRKQLPTKRLSFLKSRKVNVAGF